MARMVDQVHAHGALAGVELWIRRHRRVEPHQSREAPRSASPEPSGGPRDPIRRRPGWTWRTSPRSGAWHRAAARARRAGRLRHHLRLCLPRLLAGPVPLRRSQPAQRRCLRRLAWRTGCRLVRELLEETKEAVGDTAPLRHAPSDRGRQRGRARGRRKVGPSSSSSLAALLRSVGRHGRRLWREMGVSRFVEQGYQESLRRLRASSVTGKPVAGVGRFTSPDTMVAQVRRGVLDLIGAARPSIADPFLPNKIARVGSKTSASASAATSATRTTPRGVPIRCTQNPTMGEEWRRGWHPGAYCRRRTPRRPRCLSSAPARPVSRRPRCSPSEATA